jgi:SAM-dependent methyltransferase
VNGELPARYLDGWRWRFERAALLAPRPQPRILDVGCGPLPSLLPERRPERCRYVALDVSRKELGAAPPGSFDDIVVADVVDWVPELEGRFDLVLGYHVFEHVKPVAWALANLRGYLRPGGKLVALVSGAFAVFALANRALPDRLGQTLMRRLMARDPETVFHAYYDACWYGALERMLAPWSEVEIVPMYQGAEYFNFSPALRSLYVHYENWAARGDHRNLATHYLVEAVR